MGHTHKLTIADQEAVGILERKLRNRGIRKEPIDKILKAAGDATRRYRASDERERRAFFHGLLTGYAVALKLC